jgi:hypothetical protein
MRILRPSDPTPRFYAYKDSETDTYYFHNPISNESVWVPPSDCFVMNSDSLTPFSPEDGHRSFQVLNTEPFLTPFPRTGRREHRSSSQTRISASFSGRLFKPRLSHATTLLLLTEEVSNHPAGVDVSALPRYFPLSIHTDQSLTDFNTFVKGYFKAIKKPTKKTGPPEDLSVADDNVGRIPLLKSVDHKFSKAAVRLFTYILSYGKGTNDRPVSFFVEQIFSNIELIDEAYIQVLRQTRHNPSVDASLKMWTLVLVLCTIFFGSPVIQPVVRHTLATAAFSENERLAHVAQLAYLRFDGRCQVGVSLKSPSSAFIESIPGHITDCHYTLGASLFELLWQQKNTLPQCPVPVFMHRICQALIAQGAFEKEGVFKNSGNQQKVEKLCADIDNGRDNLAEADVHVLTTVFKRWLLLLPQPLVPIDVYPKLLEPKEGKNYVLIAAEIPQLYRDSLAYLVGFLKDFVKAESKTKMGLVPAATMFGLTVVRPGTFNQSKMKELYEVSKEFVIALIQSWDVSDIYPLNEELCQ